MKLLERLDKLYEETSSFEDPHERTDFEMAMDDAYPALRELIEAGGVLVDALSVAEPEHTARCDYVKRMVRRGCDPDCIYDERFREWQERIDQARARYQAARERMDGRELCPFCETGQSGAEEECTCD